MLFISHITESTKLFRARHIKGFTHVTIASSEILNLHIAIVSTIEAYTYPKSLIFYQQAFPRDLSKSLWGMCYHLRYDGIKV